MTGTGTDPSTDRCPDCGHLYEFWCDCSCCYSGNRPLSPEVLAEYERIAALLGRDE